MKRYRMYDVTGNKYNIEVDGGFNFRNLDTNNAFELEELLCDLGYVEGGYDEPEEDMDEHDYSCPYDYSICGREEPFSYYDNAIGRM